MSSPPGVTDLPLDPANELAHGLVASLAAEAGLRVLAIKGPVAGHYDLRPARTSSDIDILVAPDDTQELLRLLLGLGWRRRPESDAHRLFVRHSISLVNPSWPNDIDVHVSFPGMFVPAQDAFEALWEGRETLEIGHVPCDIPNAAGAFLISTLHSLRSHHDVRSRSELALAQAWLARNPERATAVTRLAAATGADEVLSDVFPGIGMPTFVEHTAAWYEWRVHTAQLNRTGPWLRLLLQTRGAQRLRLAKRALVPSREAMVLDHPGVDGSARALMCEYLSRWIRAFLALPEAYRVVKAVLASRVPAEVGGSQSARSPRPTRDVLDIAPPPLTDLFLSQATADRAAENLRLPRHGATASAWFASDDSIFTLDAAMTKVLTFSGPAAQVWQTVREESLSLDAARAYVAEQSGIPPEAADEYLTALWALWFEAGVTP